ncbi:MAG: hypothetical protein OHK0017_11400 [Patescibacteria group bacterium]
MIVIGWGTKSRAWAVLPALKARLEAVLNNQPLPSLSSDEVSPVEATAKETAVIESVQNSSEKSLSNSHSENSQVVIQEESEVAPDESDKQFLVCEYSYFSFFWIFSIVTSKKWLLMGEKRSQDVKLTKQQVKSVFGGRLPSVGWWQQYSLLSLLVLFVLIAIVPVVWAMATGQPVSSNSSSANSTVETGGKIKQLSDLTEADLQQALVWEPLGEGQVKSRQRVVFKSAENAEFIVPAVFYTADDQEITGYFKILNKDHREFTLQDLTLVTSKGQVKLTYPDGKPSPEVIQANYEKLGRNKDIFPLSAESNIEGFSPTYKLDTIEGFIYKHTDGKMKVTK